MTGRAPGIWIAVAESGEVGRALLACEAAERKLVLYRQEDGRPVALDDECWHRLLPLSNGRLDGDNVVCAYHGLTFGPDGQCVRARLGEPPARAKVHSHNAVDWAGLVWVWTEGGGDVVSGETEGGSLGIRSRRRFLPPKCADQ